MRYDVRNKILYKVNPMAQAVVGQFFGYMAVMGSYINAIPYNPEKHEIKYTYKSLNNWNQLLENIR